MANSASLHVTGQAYRERHAVIQKLPLITAPADHEYFNARGNANGRRFDLLAIIILNIL